MPKIDFLRIEKRFTLPKGEVLSFKKQIAELLEPITYSDNHVTQTIYLNNDDLSVPWGTSLRARRYIKKEQKIVSFDSNEKFICELKKECIAGSQKKIKTKQEMSLPSFIAQSKEQLLNNDETIAVRPHIVTQFVRSHYILKSASNLRLTIDENVRFGYFEKDGPFIWIGREDGARIEIKVSTLLSNKATYIKLLDIINKHGALMIVSKKDQAYNFLSDYRKKQTKPSFDELKGIELEAKFRIESKDPRLILTNLKKAFEANEIEGYNLTADPFVQIASSINFYWSSKKTGNETEALKLLCKGQKIRSGSKDKVRILPDNFGLHCLVKRHESKGRRIKYTRRNLAKILNEFTRKYGKLSPLGSLKRTRVAIWPQNTDSGRFYHISVDRCLVNNNVIYQMEIEYDGRANGKRANRDLAEKEITKELANLAWKVYKFANLEKTVLFPDPKPKFQWLSAIKK